MATVAKTSRTSTSTLGASSAGPFLLGFRLFDDDGLEVYVDQVRRADWTLTASYTSGYSDAAYITFDAALDTGSVLTITSALDPWREEDYVNGDPNLVAKMNVELGRVWSVLRDHEEKHRRSVKLFNEEDPIPDGVNALFGFDASGGLTSVPLANVVAQAILLGGDLSDIVAGVSIPRNALNAAMLATTLTNGQVAMMDGLAYLKDDSATGVASATNDLSVDGLVPFLIGAAQHYGMAIDGVTDDKVKLQALSDADVIQILPNGDYAVSGALTAQSRPKIFIGDNATVDGQLRPMIALSKYAPDALPRTMLFVEQQTAHRDDTVTAYVQRVVTTDDGITNPKALKVLTSISAGGGDQIEWAISGEVTNSDNTRTGAEGGTAVSGVALKQAANTGIMFGGHFQVKDETVAATVGGIVGVEVNIQGNGADTNSNRIGIDLIAKTYSSGTAGEFVAGLRVRNNDAAAGGKWTNAILIEDGTQATPHGVNIQNSPGSGTGYGISDTGTKAVGAIFGGTYGSAAIRLTSGNYIAMEATSVIKTAYGVTSNIWGFYNGANERVGFDMTATPRIRVGGTAILGARKTGWATATGTATRTTFDTSTVTLPQLAERVKAIIDDLHSTAGHGLIGT